jgi:hypothetical protein
MEMTPHAQLNELHRELATLVDERQRLRAESGDRPSLEQNRRQIVARQWQLAAALIAVHHQPAHAA